VFKTRGGVFKDPVQVELSTSVGMIRYTMDGSEPTSSSTEYTRPIALSRSALIKAKAFVQGQAPSPTVLETFTLTHPGPANFTSKLPIIIINTFGRYISANT